MSIESRSKKCINVLVVDDNQEYTDQLIKKIVVCEDIVIAGIARTGMEALEMINVVQPDVVLLDIIIPGIDGICVLERAVSSGLCPDVSFIVVTTAGHDSTVSKAVRFGIEYYMLKPFMVEVLIRRIRQVYNEMRRYDRKSIKSSRKWYWHYKNLLADNANSDLHVAKMMHRMGLKPNITGYYYLLKAIAMISKKPELKSGITSLLYPAIAREFSITSEKVERSIRNAINISWKNGNPEMREVYREKPTNSEFICTIAEWVRISKIK